MQGEDEEELNNVKNADRYRRRNLQGAEPELSPTPPPSFIAK